MNKTGGLKHSYEHKYCVKVFVIVMAVSGTKREEKSSGLWNYSPLRLSA